MREIPIIKYEYEMRHECMSVPDNIRKQPKNERALSADSLNKIMSSRHGTTLLSAVVSLGKSYSTKYDVQYSEPQKSLNIYWSLVH